MTHFYTKYYLVYIIGASIALAGCNNKVGFQDHGEVAQAAATPLIVRFTTPPANTAARLGLTVNGMCKALRNVAITGTGTIASLSVPCPGGSFSVPITFSAGDGVKNLIATQVDDDGTV